MEKKTSKIIDSVYEVRKTLGEGATSVVFEAKDTKSGKKLAVKIYKEYNKRKLLEENFKNEVEVIQNVKHENIVNLITYNLKGVLENKGKKENIMYLGLELAENHQLFDYIAPPNTNFNEIFTRAIFKQILMVLKLFIVIKLHIEI